MLKKMIRTVLYVNDQDKTLEFYTKTLGLSLQSDMVYYGIRWITVSPVEQPDFGIVILKADSAEAKALVGKQSPDAPLLVFTTNDVTAEYESLSDKGVKFIEQPLDKPWGREARFLDPSENVINLFEQK